MHTVMIGIALVTLLPAGAYAQQKDRADALLDFADHLEGQRAALIEIRRDIHRYPEASGREERTARIVAERLEAAGFEVRTGVGGHGVVGVLRGPTSGPVLAFRADMDAVRGSADDPMEFRSQIDQVNHICGHDIHTTVGLALAEGFAAIREELSGSVMLIFQPAEETATGARAMLDDGVFADLTPDAVFAYHTAPLEVGQIVTASGTLLPGRDAVRVDVRGDGDLESVAREVRRILMKTATEGSNEPSRPVSDEFVRVNVGPATRSGSSGSWSAQATLTTASHEASSRARSEIERGLEALERPGLTLELEYRERWVAGVTNDPQLVELANASARTVLGEDGVIIAQSIPTVFSEDFGSFQEQVPGVMYFLGVSNSEMGWVGMPHNPDYVADEEAIFVGAQTMAAVFLDLFEP